MNKTDIEWTTFTSNPLKYRRKSDGKVVWACVKTSSGCAHCYAEAIALRFVRGKLFNARNMEELEPFLDEAELRKMLTAKTIQGIPVDGSKCFVGDMTDVFGEWVPDELLDRLFAVFALRQDVTWQVLTKRAGRMQSYFADLAYRQEQIGIDAESLGGLDRYILKLGTTEDGKPRWPLPLRNVWLGVSCEDQQRADERREPFLSTPAAMKFVSYEPALGPVNWTGWEFVNQIISGGESGPKARPHHQGWHRVTRDFCVAHRIAYFFKQWGEYGPEQIGPVQFTPVASGVPMDEPASMFRVGKKAAGRLLDGQEWSQFPAVKGAKP